MRGAAHKIGIADGRDPTENGSRTTAEYYRRREKRYECSQLMISRLTGQLVRAEREFRFPRYQDTSSRKLSGIAALDNHQPGD